MFCLLAGNYIIYEEIKRYVQNNFFFHLFTCDTFVVAPYVTQNNIIFAQDQKNAFPQK